MFDQKIEICCPKHYLTNLFSKFEVLLGNYKMKIVVSIAASSAKRYVTISNNTTALHTIFTIFSNSVFMMIAID